MTTEPGSPTVTGSAVTEANLTQPGFTEVDTTPTTELGNKMFYNSSIAFVSNPGVNVAMPYYVQCIAN